MRLVAMGMSCTSYIDDYMNIFCVNKLLKTLQAKYLSTLRSSLYLTRIQLNIHVLYIICIY